MADKKYPSESQDRFIVRFPDDEMRARIASAAAANSRSMNAEIVHRLESSFASAAVTDQRLQWEVESLRDQLEAMKRVYKITDVTSRFMAGMLVKVIDRLPVAQQKEHTVIRALAEGIDKNDTRAIGKGFMTIFQGDPEVTTTLQRTLDHLEPSIAAKERGEDLTPYKEEDIRLLREGIHPLFQPKEAVPAASQTRKAAGTKTADAPKKTAAERLRQATSQPKSSKKPR